jgi:excisionase family DNA binding protein
LSESQSEPQASRGRRLDTWKEIASYLRIGVRTAQLWHETKGLPVWRTGNRVFAYSEELDHWWQSIQQPLPSSREPAKIEPAQPSDPTLPLQLNEVAKPPQSVKLRTQLLAALLGVLAVLCSVFLMARWQTQPQAGVSDHP